MEATTVEEFYGLEDLTQFEVVKLEEFYETVVDMLKEDEDERIRNLLRAMETRILKLEELEEEWTKRDIPRENFFHDNLKQRVENTYTDKVFTFKRKLKVPLINISPNGIPPYFSKDIVYVKEMKDIMAQIIENERCLFRFFLYLTTDIPNFLNKIRCMPELRSKLFE